MFDASYIWKLRPGTIAMVTVRHHPVSLIAVDTTASGAIAVHAAVAPEATLEDQEDFFLSGARTISRTPVATLCQAKEGEPLISGQGAALRFGVVTQNAGLLASHGPIRDFEVLNEALSSSSSQGTHHPGDLVLIPGRYAK